MHHRPPPPSTHAAIDPRRYNEPSDAWTALFTTNAFPGAPVRVGKRRLAAGGPLRAILVNNKISNVCPGGAPGAGEASGTLTLSLILPLTLTHTLPRTQT